ncbi:hypothetical protein K431DRAFT_113462 [Polychaeton citri CBS 116435]|uniref:Uncharacterized protein n=1 Tax=Polychaeton citri CBS 116435 TaxID=1314669 RepID=A0A9P4Q4K5_9PEZI|nr:hypothetical protein K431DRAFT_113462 [Polychaeton citri CBS 116435]
MNADSLWDATRWREVELKSSPYHHPLPSEPTTRRQSMSYTATAVDHHHQHNNSNSNNNNNHHQHQHHHHHHQQHNNGNGNNNSNHIHNQHHHNGNNHWPGPARFADSRARPFPPPSEPYVEVAPYPAPSHGRHTPSPGGDLGPPQAVNNPSPNNSSSFTGSWQPEPHRDRPAHRPDAPLTLNIPPSTKGMYKATPGHFALYVSAFWFNHPTLLCVCVCVCVPAKDKTHIRAATD